MHSYAFLLQYSILGNIGMIFLVQLIEISMSHSYTSLSIFILFVFTNATATACILHRIFKDNISLKAHIIFYEKMAARIDVCIAIFV